MGNLQGKLYVNINLYFSPLLGLQFIKDKDTKEKAYINAVQAAVELAADEMRTPSKPDISPKTVCIKIHVSKLHFTKIK